MANDKKSFVLYTDMAQHINLLTDEQAGQLLKGLFIYVKTDQAPVFDDGIIAMAFSFIRAQLDRDCEKYEQVCAKRREAGKQGGRPKTNQKQTKAKKANGFSQKQSKAKKTDNDTDTENENDILCGEDKPPKQKRFLPPTVDEVESYCKERCSSVDAARFVDYYEAVGWYIGKRKMKDWRAAVRSWERNAQEITQPVEQRRRVDREL